LNGLYRVARIAGPLCLLPYGCALADDTDGWWSRGYALEAFAGPVTTRETTQIVRGTMTFNHGGIIAITGSKELTDLGCGFAIRGQLLIAHRFDGLDYDEFTFLLGMEYSQFPWSQRWPTTVEVSTGPSYATKISPVEFETSGDPTRWLNAVGVEVAVSPSAGSPWAFVGRYHHRSSAFGLYGGNQDESTAFTVGAKYRF
jgi:hypothetical protein